ncbi:receptor-interacting serine/threonine-protein kinase 4-like [Haliotis rubra]|uniref:receptor-interacting serine/threonine-protein kinase 4-like n=1 Tax=Haliotis rubra TaxID=36100 RepID=UPI001EE4FCCE|nr:receptor-interacting serine/threonine-protein kinase 4-like [Haliotis rubra]
MAAEKGHRQVVKLLLRKGADASLLDHDGNNIFHLACRGGHVRTVQLVLSLIVADVNSRGWWSRTLMMLAAWYKHRDVVELLVRGRVDVSLVDDGGNSLLYFACRG